MPYTPPSCTFGRSSILLVTLDFSGSIFVAVIVDFKGCDPRVMRLWSTSRFALTPASAFYILELGSVWRVQIGVGIGCQAGARRSAARLSYSLVEQNGNVEGAWFPGFPGFRPARL